MNRDDNDRAMTPDERAVLLWLGILLSLPAITFEGWVLAWLWFWFAVPHGAPILNLWTMAGVSVMVGLMTARPTAADRTFKESIGLIIFPWLAGAVALGYGFIIHMLAVRS